MQRLERVTNLLAILLETRRPVTLDQIAQELVGQYPDRPEARRTAFERDKAILRSQGVPIRQEVLGGDAAGQTGYWVERSEYELADLDLTADERRAVQMALATVHLGTRWGEEAWWKLERPQDGPVYGASEIAAVLPADADLPLAYQAVAQRRRCEFSYRGRDRHLEAYGLLSRHGHWYLVGRDVDAEEVRAYRLDRMASGSLRVGDPEAFVRPEGFSVAEAFPADARAVGDPGDGPSVARVRISGPRATTSWSARGIPVLEDGDDASVVVEVPCVNRPAFRSWVLSLGEDAEVLGPPEIRSEMVAWLQALAGEVG